MDIKCYIDNVCAQKLKYYVGATKLEISGIGKSEIINGDIYLRDVIIFKQKCTGASTDLDEQDMARVQYQMTKAGDDLKNWNVWWHSHANMGVFWSGTDTTTINEHANNGSFLVSLVTNHKGEFKTRVDTFPKDVSPFDIVTFVNVQDDIPTTILPVENNPERYNEIDEILNKAYADVTEETDEITKVAKEELDRMFKEVTDQRDALIKEKNDGFNEKYNDLFIEYDKLSNVAVEDPELKEKIEAEVNEKIATVITYLPRKTKMPYWFDKENSVQDAIDSEIDYLKGEFGISNRQRKFLDGGFDEDDDLDYSYDGYKREFDKPTIVAPSKKSLKKKAKLERIKIYKEIKKQSKIGFKTT